MKDITEYQIFIGCNDSQLRHEVMGEVDLRKTVVQFFRRRELGFSIFKAQGGYIHGDGEFVYEDSLCINIIADYDLDIIKLARSLSMYMNQECSLVVKQKIKSIYL